MERTERTEEYMLTQRSHTPGPDGKQARETSGQTQTLQTVLTGPFSTAVHVREPAHPPHHASAESSRHNWGSSSGSSSCASNRGGTQHTPDTTTTIPDTPDSGTDSGTGDGARSPDSREVVLGRMPNRGAFTDVPRTRNHVSVGRTAAGAVHLKHPSLAAVAPPPPPQAREPSVREDVVQGAPPVLSDKRERPYTVEASCGPTTWIPAEAPTVCRADGVIALRMRSCCAFPLLVSTEVFLRTEAGVYQLDTSMRSVVRSQGRTLLGRVALPDSGVEKSSLKTMEASGECELLLATAEFHKQIGDKYDLILQATVHEAREGGHVWKWTFPLHMSVDQRAGKRKACGPPAPIQKRQCVGAQ